MGRGGGIAASLLLATAAQPGLAAQGSNDAHMIRLPRGDIIDVRQGVGDSAQARRAVQVGDRLGANAYAPREAVASPAGLPPARRGTRWVRFNGELMLVDIRAGRVLRVEADRVE